MRDEKRRQPRNDMLRQARATPPSQRQATAAAIQEPKRPSVRHVAVLGYN